MESVTLAYQGFAKQQYQLLDNLKLGYGGTKGEMERLLKDAEALTGIKYNINNLADVYSAIHAIQEELGIAGTTAKEAEKTISGSVATTKAAWQNVLTAISGGGDLDRAIENLVDSISNLFNNIVPVVERSLQGIGRLIERVAPQLVQSVAKSLIRAIPSLLDAVYEMIVGLAKGVYQGIMALFYGEAIDSVKKQAEAIEKATANQKNLTDAVKETNKELKGALAGFDEVNTLSKPEDTMESLGGFGGSEQGNTMQVEVETEINEPTLKSNIATIQKILEPVTNSLKKLIDVTIKWNKSLDFKKIKKEFGGLTKSLSNAVGMIGATFGVIYTEILLPLGDWLITDITPVWLGAFRAGINMLSNAVGVLTAAYKSFFKTIEPLTTFVSDILLLAFQTFQEVFENVSSTIIEKSSTINHIFTSLGEIVASLQPIFEVVLFVVGEVVSVFGDLIGSVFGGVIEVLSGAIDFLIGVFSADWERAWSGIKDIFVGLWEVIKGVFVALFDLIVGILEPIVNWINEYVIQPVAKIFSWLWDKISAGFKATVNFFIDMINGMIGALESFVNSYVKAINWIISSMNKVSFDVPDWVPGIGGSKWGFDFKKIEEVKFGRIPELAQGAVIPGGREFLAVLGDQPKGQTNIEAPLDTIKQALAEVMSDFGGNGNNQPIIIEIDGKEVFRAVRNAETRYGSRLVTGGV